MRDIRNYLDSLASLAHPDGGWGYAPGQSAHLEPTCLGLLALSLDADRFAAALKPARAAWSAAPAATASIAWRGREEAVWPTALVLFTQAVLGRSDEARRTAAALLALRGRASDTPQAARSTTST